MTSPWFVLAVSTASIAIAYLISSAFDGDGGGQPPCLS